MTKLEYSDFYRFLVSLGVILVGLAFLLPWLFLRESFDSLITSSEIAELTPTAQTLLLHRQSTALWIVQNMIWISGLLAVVGLGLLIIGIFLWWTKQQSIRDQKEKLETEKLKLEIKEIGLADKVKKTAEEIEEEMALEDMSAAKMAEETEQLLEGPSTASIISEYIRIEEIVINKLKDCFGANNLLANKRIRQTEYDAILQSSRTQSADIVFEIKYIKFKFSFGKVHQTIKNLILSTQAYMRATGRNATGVALFVLSQESLNRSQINRLKESIKANVEMHDVEIIDRFIPEEHLATLSCKDLRRIIYSDDGDILRK